MSDRISRYDKPQFSGDTFDEERDGPRLANHMRRVVTIMGRGYWLTLQAIAIRAKCSTQAASARLRDLRNKHGFIIEKKYVGRGVWKYRMSVWKMVKPAERGKT